MTLFQNTITSVDDRPALVSRQADFWLLGGASIAFWALCHLFEFLYPRFHTTQSYLSNLPALFAIASLVVNAPHFMASYHLAYSRGGQFILQNWYQLILVPVLLVLALLAGDIYFNDSIPGWQNFGKSLNDALAPFGIFLVVGIYPSFGQELMHHLVSLMYLTVGWHYTKQVFGCFMVYSRYDNYALNNTERNLIKASLLSIWGFNFFSINSSLTQTDFFSISTMTHVFPAGLYLFFELLTVGLFLAVGYQVFYRRWKLHGVLPPAPALVAWIAMFIWWMPFARSLTFFVIAVPFFHGLQYLPFYKKVIDARYNDPETSARSFNFYFGFLVLAGFIAFNIGPEALDYLRDSESRMQVTYWIAGVALLINIHHFFIDNAIWRLRDEKVRRWLLH